MSDQQRPRPRQPTEEELRAAYEAAAASSIRVEDVLVQTVVSLLNLGGRRPAWRRAPRTSATPSRSRPAIEGVRALLPLVEPQLGPDAAQIREALSQLQIAYAQVGRAGRPGGAERAGAPAAASSREPPSGPGPAQPAGRLWVPGSNRRRGSFRRH